MEGTTIDNIPMQLLTCMAQLTRINSIEGSKKPSLKIVYTPVTNVTKEKGLDVGTVVFKDKSLCRYTTIVADKDLSKLIMKTKKELYPNLKQQHDDYVKEMYMKKKEEEIRAKKEYELKKKEELMLKQSFEEVTSKDKMKTNKESAQEDFW